ncbi:MAG: T9SS type A sorting domain-containing protein [Lentimicrobium sp.]|uniref:T9SS type A sorting domain-containing protein n=3 Tax=Lentimicrobium sp. TaxID=2034841 RepID=UPI0025D9C9F6|nr:T9SS type A sorting domain-containing protein [Lentimicrobium sp.]MCO5255152.1 T9SS type A sorting domain-containing protein [Lentimicrobium sp.]MCO5263853.1 T9SS type A sorting domain-containing protein [Lentimicrobium sp.]
MKLKRILIFLALLASFSIANAQKQANYWYFGQYAGLSFAMGPPVPLNNGALNTGEGCSSISTASGALEFYTDGRFVYNKNHAQMPNGFGLWGHSSSTQSGIIVPKPGSTTEYYIFTVDAADNGLANGLSYTKVDMLLNDGLGDVVTTEKNISLVPLACEKVTAVGHADGQTFWVITKKWGNSDFYAYRITWDGVNTTPVISSTGPPLVGNIGQASKGYLKVSPDGTKIAAANNTAFDVGIYNFDNSTGVITHLVTDNSYTNPGGGDPGGPYGVEFSPNSSRLYIGEWKSNRKIHQYDLSSGDPATILNSRTVVASVGQSSDPIGALQLGPDNRLYIARYGSPYLSRINQPNVLGTACEFVENAVNLGGRECRYGLPPFIQSFFYLTVDFYWDEPACDGNQIHFYASASDTPDSLKWTFPDGSNSVVMNPTYTFPGPGLYGVGLVVYLYGQSKTVNRFIRIHPATTVSLGNDTTICASEAFYIDPGVYNSYLWHDGSVSQTILGDTSGWYRCTVANEWGCTATDSVYLTVNPNPEVNAGPDTGIPEGTSYTIPAAVAGGSGNYSYQWEPAALLLNANVLQPTTVVMNTTTTFTLTVTDNQTGCVSQDEVLITVEGGVLSCNAYASPPSICLGDQTQLTVLAYGGTGQYTYEWTSSPPGFSSTIPEPTVAPVQTTTYTVTVNDGESSVSRTVVVTIHPLPVVSAGADQIIPHGTSAMLISSVTGGTGPYTYQWSPDNMVLAPTMPVTPTNNLYVSQSFTLEVTDHNGCESASQTMVIVEGGPLHVNPTPMDSVICRGDTTRLQALPGGGSGIYESYSWTSDPPGFVSDEPDPLVAPLVETTYFVEVYDGFNPTSGSTAIRVNPLPSINLPPVGDPRVQLISPNEIGVCVYDTITLNAGNPGSLYLWSNGSVTQTIDIKTSGISFDIQEYNVIVNNPVTGCTNQAEISVYFTFQNCSYGIDETIADNRLQVYPNPSSGGVFNIQIEGLKGHTDIEVYSLQGKRIYAEGVTLIQGNSFSSTLSLGNCKPGLYYLRLANEDAVIMRKLIVQQM